MTLNCKKRPKVPELANVTGAEEEKQRTERETRASKMSNESPVDSREGPVSFFSGSTVQCRVISHQSPAQVP